MLTLPYSKAFAIERDGHKVANNAGNRDGHGDGHNVSNKDGNRDSHGGRDRYSGRQEHRGSSNEVVIFGHQRYRYRDGRFYRPSWFGFEFIVYSPPIGAIVSFLPFGHRTIIIGNTSYYYYENVYYSPCPSGYMVVPRPVDTPKVVYVPSGEAKSSVTAGDTITINVPNANGSYTAITLVKLDNGYMGPQGEYYPGHPTIAQLSALYGK
ncbi:MAG: DUF6515 family protein [Candidatus Omnitrophota bacterium]